MSCCRSSAECVVSAVSSAKRKSCRHFSWTFVLALSVERLKTFPSGLEVDTFICKTECMLQHHSKEDSKQVGSQNKTLAVSLRFVCWRQLMLSRQRRWCLSCLFGNIWWCWEAWVDNRSWRGRPYWPDRKRLWGLWSHEKWLSLLSAFLLNLFEGDRVCSGYVGTKPALWFRVDLLCKYLEPLKCYLRKDFPDNAMEGYATIIVAIASVAFIFCTVLQRKHVLWYFASQQSSAVC